MCVFVAVVLLAVMGAHPHGYSPFFLLYHFTHPLLQHIYLAQSSFGSFFPTPGFAVMLKGKILHAGKRDVIAALQDGHPVALVPGGIKEMAVAKPGSSTIYLVRNHTGFIKIAFELGLPLVPCYVFGLQDHYEPLFEALRHFIHLMGNPLPAWKRSSWFSISSNVMVIGQ